MGKEVINTVDERGARSSRRAVFHGTNGLFAHQCQQSGLSRRKLVVEKIGLTDWTGCGDCEVGGGGGGGAEQREKS